MRPNDKLSNTQTSGWRGQAMSPGPEVERHVAIRPKHALLGIGGETGIPMDAADIIIDARGHRCPVPTLRLRRALEAAEDGARLRLLADDPLAIVDVPLFLKQMGYTLEKQSQTSHDIIFDIIKVTPKAG